jgi:excisionase family DNA binding protein
VNGVVATASRIGTALSTRPDMSESYFTVREAARELGVCTATIYRLLRAGRLPALRVGAQCRIAEDGLRSLQAAPPRIDAAPAPPKTRARPRPRGSAHSFARLARTMRAS